MSPSLPLSLWTAETLHLPPAFVGAYSDELISRGLLEEARAGTHEKDVWGGPSEKDTLKHFKFRFANSSVRVERLCVDAGGTFGSLPASLYNSFHTGRVAVLDIPCGAGASTLSLLATLAELRKNGALPSLPLNVSIFGADISTDALTICESMVQRLQPELGKYSVYPYVTTFRWDATSTASTNDLVDRWFAAAEDQNEYFVLIGNVSGVGKSQFDQMSRSFEHIAERISNKPSTLLWVEPGIRSGRQFLAEKLQRYWSYLGSLFGAGSSSAGVITTEFNWWHPIEAKRLDGSVAIHRFIRQPGPST
jgi:hypothetical protein